MRGDSDETGSWNTIWISARSVPAVRPLGVEDVDGARCAVEDDRAGVGRDRAHQDLAECGFAAAAFADEPETFAAPHVEADAVHGADRGLVPCRTSRTCACVKVLHHVARPKAATPGAPRAALGLAGHQRLASTGTSRSGFRRSPGFMSKCGTAAIRPLR